MPFIPLNLNEAHESKPVPNGKYSLQIMSSEETTTKEKGKPQYKVGLAIEGHDDAPTVYHYQGIPSTEDDPQAMQFKMLLLKRFLTAFNVPFSSDGFDTTQLAVDMIGAKANLELQLSEPDANGNVYNRLVLPRLKEESTKGTARPPLQAAGGKR